MLGGASPTTENNSTTTSHDQVLEPTTAGLTKRKKNSSGGSSSSSSRRFSDEQIKSLESLFKTENKLEARKKLELARELGLHPRQVAIWFQNRRARWKSKQVEQDYTSLKADYDTLSHRFESLKKEKHDLLQQLSNLCSQLKDPYHVDSSGSENSRGPLEQDMAEDEEDDPNHNKLDEEEELDMPPALTDQQVAPCNFLDLGSLIFDQSCSNWWDAWPSN